MSLHCRTYCCAFHSCSICDDSAGNKNSRLAGAENRSLFLLEEIDVECTIDWCRRDVVVGEQVESHLSRNAKKATLLQLCQRLS